MRRIALQSLVHDRGKMLAALAGVAFATTLVLVQIGLYFGFLDTSSAVIRRVGGDLWVIPRGTPVVDNAETLSAGTRSIVSSHPCVAGVRGLAMSFVGIRNGAGIRDTAIVIGFEPDGTHVMPWSMATGLPADLHAPGRVTVDSGDVGKLRLPADPMHAQLEVNGQAVYVAAVTDGIRSFTLSPYMFTQMPTARRLLGMSEGQVSYWVVDLARPDCAPSVIAWIERQPELQAMRTPDWARKTEDYWVAGSGAGLALGFSAMLGLVVGAVIVGQTLYSVTKEHLRELATLKAVGASTGEIVGFVAWQVLFLAGVGGALGLALSFGVQRGVNDAGLALVMSPPVLAIGVAAVVVMCLLASIGSLRAVITLDAADVFK